MDSKDALVVFEGAKIRRMWHDEQWHFSVVDIVGSLTDSSIPRRYWSDLKIKLNEEGFELYDKIVQLKLPSSDGKNYNTDCANTESMFRIIQSIPSKREYSILTDEISKATFGLTPGEYKKFKGLKQQNLRDHMDDLELIFNMLGEGFTTKIIQMLLKIFRFIRPMCMCM